MRPVALAFAFALALLLALPLRAAAGLEVVASIAPVHSLVARVMQGAGTPYLLLPAGASPHGHALRPSGAVLRGCSRCQHWAPPDREGQPLPHVSRYPGSAPSLTYGAAT